MLNLSCGGSHHKFPINMWTYGKLCPSMVAILDTISFYGGHLGYYPSMEVILDTMSFYGGHLGLDIMSFNGDHLGYYVLLWRSSWIFNQPKNHTLCQEPFQCHSQQIQFQRTMTTDTKF